MEELEGKVAAITGGGSGIGEALAHACARAGMDVSLADIELEKAEQVAAAVRESGRRAIATQADVAKFDSVKTFADRTFDELGACHLLANNAGVLVMGATHERTLEDWEWILGVNVKGVIHGVRAFVPRIIEQGQGGHIVNTASISGLLALPANGAYATSKFAVLGLTESLRIDLAGEGIGVSALCPAAVKTGILKSQRNRPKEFGESKISRKDALAVMEAGDAANATFVDPEQVAVAVLAAVRNDEPYVITHPGIKPHVEARLRAILEAHDTARERFPDLP